MMDPPSKPPEIKAAAFLESQWLFFLSGLAAVEYPQNPSRLNHHKGVPPVDS